jgi:hypothetical protein
MFYIIIFEKMYGILICLILWCYRPFKTSPIGIGILRIVKSGQESIFDILLSKQVFMKKYYKRKKKKQKK